MKSLIILIALLTGCIVEKEKTPDYYMLYDKDSTGELIVIDSIETSQMIDYEPYTWLVDSTVTPPVWKVLQDSAEVWGDEKYYKFDSHTWVRRIR